ncbi:MAG: hypothetical protein HC925_02310, partial [Coleofasciculaceae cyanobacterium SM2_3_26]|nr:hypothetical protein [Coleofasciculaceae cyanobacterium SM2_3_26]
MPSEGSENAPETLSLMARFASIALIAASTASGLPEITTWAGLLSFASTTSGVWAIAASRRSRSNFISAAITPSAPASISSARRFTSAKPSSKGNTPACIQRHIFP